ncbi:hypothetical protein [Haladaptatus salinisoli]|uniref:hypothetical protein n=1 Tax=Haladaptatus salinisoli TaxID=2884876 RepID=UPI001D0A4DC1|nr:hypothetical protein [Haladaptatus salinisoli]
MTEITRRTYRTPLGILVGLWALWGLYALWTSGIDWQNWIAVTTVGGITAVCLGALAWAIGTATGDRSKRTTAYRRLVRVFSGLGIVLLGALAITALVFG